MRQKYRFNAIDRDTRISIVSEYLLGRSLKEIAYKWQITQSTIIELVREVKDFKLRNRRKDKDA